MRFLIALICLLTLTVGSGRAEQGEIYPRFHNIDDPSIMQFAVTFLRKFDKQFFEGERGLDRIRRDVEVAEADIDDDGIPELFLVIENAYYCGTAGCIAFIFKKNATGYELICGAELDTQYGGGTGSAILPEKDFGIHRIRAAEAIIHWYAGQKPNSGNQCWGEDLVQ